jgi:hypothetical protein
MRTTIPNCLRCFTSRRLFLPFAALVFLTFVLGLYPQPALAQSPSSPGGGVDDSNGVFQLEGNAVTDTSICFGISSTGPVIATPGAGNSCPSGESFVTFSGSEDWDKIFAGSTTPTATTGIVNDAFNSLTDNQFTGGSTKDTNDFSQWLWAQSKPQGKDDFEHAYAAAYTRSSDSHVIIVAGVDRYDNNGSSTAGFWFVQDQNVGSGTATACATVSSSGCPFGGTHKDGDFLIISQFTVGGSVSTIQVFTWSGGANGSLNTTPLVTGVQCDPRSGSANLCGTVNGVPVLSGGWGFTPKHVTSCSTSGTGAATGPNSTKTNCMDTGEFLEIGFDLTAAFAGKTAPCISKFFAESRASGTGLTSTLSDFVTPTSFPLCTLNITKTCNGASFVSGNNVEYDFGGTITATGGTFSSLSVTDSPNNGNTTGISNVSVTGPCSNAGPYTNVNTCASVTSVSPGTPAYYAGSFDSTFESNTLPNTATVSGVTPEGATTTASASWIVSPNTTLPSNCTPTPGSLALSKTCFVTRIDSNLAIHVHFSGTVTNNSGIEVDNVSVTDTPDGGSASGNLLASGTNLANGASATFSGDYVATQCSPINSNPAQTLGGLTIEDQGRCQFSDTVNASGTGAVTGTGTITAPSNQAMCNLCPGGVDNNNKSYCAGN